MKRILLGLLVLALAACGDSSSTGKKKYRFALIPNDSWRYENQEFGSFQFFVVVLKEPSNDWNI